MAPFGQSYAESRSHTSARRGAATPKARAFVDYLVEKLRDNPCVQVSERACMPKLDDEVRVLVPERSFAAY